jgi:hypothetical protein
MAILEQEALNKRAALLDAQGLNGIKLVLVRLNPVVNPAEAILSVQFFNTHELAGMVAAFGGDPTVAKQFFPITGGRRIPAGQQTGQVQTITIAAGATPTTLDLTIRPIGDYSIYKLHVEHANFDPMFSEIKFKFRPGCFNADCSPEWTSKPRAPNDPAIDYLAKDFDSFRHTMIVAMMQRVPGWRPTSEADLDQVLLELFSAAADELSDYQDRVMNEAYLATVRKRVSLARHARLVDYHIHEGNQGSTILALEISAGQSGVLPAGLRAWTGLDVELPDSQVFLGKQPLAVDSLVNRIGLYTWSDAAPSLEAGATTADLKLRSAGQAPADQVRDLINNGTIPRLLVQEWLNPATGRPAAANPHKRQILRLLKNATTVQDPLTTEFMVRVNWRDQDKLLLNYCFTVECTNAKVEDVSLFHGNLLDVTHGIPREWTFHEPGTPLVSPNDRHFERTARWGAICRLPTEPLAYEDTPPGGDSIPKSTLEVVVQTPSGSEAWHERINLIHSDDSDTQGNHFVVETDENLLSIFRFGNGINGRELPQDALVHTKYQSGLGPDGNVGADSINHSTTPAASPVDVVRCWNPFDVTNGRAPEPPDSVIRRAPEAYLFHQLRAVTLEDYVNRAEELEEVSRAAASYAWTGSWRTVRIAIDPKGALILDDALRQKLARHLNAVRLIGEDLEIRPPIFVPLEIHVRLCAGADYWPQDLRFVIEQTFSSAFDLDGSLAFFHPDRWTFGQALHRSQIEGALLAIQGVEHVISISMKRWNAQGSAQLELIEARPNEIIEVLSDPDRMEQGFIDFDIQGGRQ